MGTEEVVAWSEHTPGIPVARPITENLTGDRTAAFRSEVSKRAITGGCRGVIVDLSGVTMINSMGVGMLVDLHTRLEQSKIALALAGPTPMVSEVLGLTQIGRLVPVFEGVEAAVQGILEGSGGKGTAS